MPELINWELIKQPYNWVIVILMLAIGIYALHLVYRLAADVPAM